VREYNPRRKIFLIAEYMTDNKFLKVLIPIAREVMGKTYTIENFDRVLMEMISC